MMIHAPQFFLSFISRYKSFLLLFRALFVHCSAMVLKKPPRAASPSYFCFSAFCVSTWLTSLVSSEIHRDLIWQLDGARRWIGRAAIAMMSGSRCLSSFVRFIKRKNARIFSAAVEKKSVRNLRLTMISRWTESHSFSGGGSGCCSVP